MSKQATVLIIDDEPNIHYSFEKLFQDTHRIISAHSAEEGISKLQKEQPDVVVMDVRMPGMDGLEALQKIRAIDAKIPVIMMTAFGTVNTAITAMKFGAFEYLLKPFDVKKMRQVIEKAVENSFRMRRMVQIPSDEEFLDQGGDLIVGSSEAMQEVYKLIGQVAAQNVPVLIRGESGTGKELVARAIYHHSQRADKPFLEINCAAIPESLLESELFGYEKGAFTGATERKIGKFEQVKGGTMFNTEILPASVAAKSFAPMCGCWWRPIAIWKKQSSWDIFGKICITASMLSLSTFRPCVNVGKTSANWCTISSKNTAMKPEKIYAASIKKR